MRRSFSIELITHFLKLIPGHSSLQGKKMLLRDAVRFIQYLPPSVLARSLGTEHRQPLCRKHDIMITCSVGEDEVRLLVVLCDNLLFETQFCSIEDKGEMMFK